MAELVLALDLPTPADALRVLDRLAGVTWVKLGSVLFTAAGPRFVDELKRRGHRVFLDLKWHDIPNTVRGSVREARNLGVDMATVHALGGRSMLRAAVEAAGAELAVVGVTVLTSHDGRSFGEAVGRLDPIPDLTREVDRLTALCVEASLAGVVCSPLEAARVAASAPPGFRCVTPGIRTGSDGRVDDQARTATVAAAARAGATHLVVGRPVLEAGDPTEAWRALTDELAGCSV
jgi:orotidine-5'-phosphate decarboxylase